MSKAKEIPRPQGHPVIGNLLDIDGKAPIQGFMRMARAFGPIFKVTLGGRDVIWVGSQELVDEVSDEARFDKLIHATLYNIRDFAGDGLFTARTDEPNWGKAHRLLRPAFGPLGMRNMFDQMQDVAEQMMLRWERFGPDTAIDVADNMTRLTLDTIALCAFDYRFNSFYQNEMHPFVDAMVGALGEAGARSRRPQIATRAMMLSERRYRDEIRLMHEVADELIARRRADPDAAGRKDLLSVMLDGRDPQTGERLDDENIRYQMVTFLIAGHETTSGLLSFATYFLLRNPDALARARAEVDAALGNEMPTIETIGKLRYLEQILMETLRIWPTAPAIGLRAKVDTTVGGYPVARGTPIMVLIPTLHRDPKVWGDDVESFRPERFESDAAAKLPPNAWKPFGNGQRACIGRPFAMQESMLVLAMMLQRFDLLDADPAYRLRVKETLTLKPEGLKLRTRLRNARPLPSRMTTRTQATLVASRPGESPVATGTAAGDDPGARLPLYVLYGSNTGSCEAFAQRIGAEAPEHGFTATVATLDEYAGQLPGDGPVIVVTASYEGQAPDNARQFARWIDGLEAGALAGVRYAVFGCGNRQWARTWQAIPMRVDAALARAGAQRLLERGETDAGGDFFGGFDAWLGGMWPELDKVSGATTPAAGATGITLEIVRDSRTRLLRQSDLDRAAIVDNRELVDMRHPGARSKRHIEFALPAGMTYRAGDYLAVLPRNPQATLDRVLRRFALEPDTLVLIHKAGPSASLPVGQPLPAGELFGSYVELGQPATRNQVRALAAAASCPPERAAIEALDEDDAYAREVLGKRVSVLDLLERHPGCLLPLEAFLAMLPPMRARQYSISSSPLADSGRCSLTIAVVDGPAASGQGRYLGVASNFLASSAVGSLVPVAVRSSHLHFHPPGDPETPIVMICAGSGLAPFRGFLQDRAMQRAAGQPVGPALLFFGCDDPDVDFLYRDQLAEWEREGVVSVRPAFSARPEGDVRFVQDRLWQDRAEVEKLFRDGATVFVCGDGQRMAPAVREVLVRMVRESGGVDDAAAQAWVEHIERDTARYVADVFA
jgi:cytochrome P450/NADPH-cytochrome P450 reductase